MSNDSLIEQLNKALAWELRAQAMYAHYAAYVKGLYRMYLRPHFEAEAAESTLHAAQVRDSIVKLGGIAVSTPAAVEIVHTDSYEVMLEEALMTEQQAATFYREILTEVDSEDEMFDVIQQIQFAEERSVDELNKLI